jgi:predicted nuclease with TOPRIM domain
MISSAQLTKLKTDKAALLGANDELAKDNANLKTKLGRHEEMVAENDVLVVENKRLEGAVEREAAENEVLRARIAVLERNAVWYEEQLRRVKGEYAQLERDYNGLVVAYNERAGGERGAGVGEEEEGGIDLAKGFDRI